MMTNRNLKLAAFRALLTLPSLAATASAQDSIKLKNGMQSPVTVLIQPERLTAPVNIRVLVNDTYDYRLKYEGLYTIQVVPDDQLDSGYHLGSHDLKGIARVLKEKTEENGTSWILKTIHALRFSLVATDPSAANDVTPVMAKES